MELCEGGELFDQIRNKGPYTESNARVALQKVVEGMLHLHTKGVLHRDMKPENIFMRDKEDPVSCVVADMDMAIVYAETTRQSRRGHVGTPGYMAPEILQNNDYDYQADVWSLGVPSS